MRTAEASRYLMVRALHALRDLKRRLQQAESRQQHQCGCVAVVVALIRDTGAGHSGLGDLCRRALAGSSGAAETAIIVVADNAGALAPEIAAQLGSGAFCIDLRGAENGIAYAAYLAVDGIARGQFPQAVLAVAGEMGCVAVLFKSMERAVRDRDPILAHARASAGESRSPATGLFEAIEAAHGGAGPLTVGRDGFSIVFTSNRPLGKDRIAEIVSEVLRLPSGNPIEAHVPCFEYGVDSMAAVEIRNRLRKETGFPLPLTLMFEYPTLDALAAYLSELQPQASDIEMPPASGPGPFPASRGQSALWGIHYLDPASPAYNLRCAVMLDPRVSLESLGEAVRLTLERHPILRVRFQEINGELMQLINPVPRDPLEIVEFDHRSGQQFISEYSSKPFDLASGPPVRFCFFRNGDSEVLLLFVGHHIVADFISMKVVLEDLRRFYSDLAKGGSPTIVPEYAFFNHVTRARALPAPAGADLVRQWKQVLGENLPILRPFSGRSRTHAMYREGREYQHAIDSTLADRISRGAKSAAGTIYQFMFAAYALVLMEASEQDDLVVGATVSLRESDAEQDAAGYFINPLPVRFRRTPAATWKQYFEAHRPAMVEILRLRALPFPALVEHLSPRRDPLVSPIFQTMFTWLSAGDSNEDNEPADPFREEVVPTGHQVAGVTHDLVLMVRPAGHDLRCTWCYRSPLLTTTDIEALARRYLEFLNSIAADSETPIPLRAAGGEREEVVI